MPSEHLVDKNRLMINRAHVRFFIRQRVFFVAGSFVGALGNPVHGET